MQRLDVLQLPGILAWSRLRCVSKGWFTINSKMKALGEASRSCMLMRYSLQTLNYLRDGNQMFENLYVRKNLKRKKVLGGR